MTTKTELHTNTSLSRQAEPVEIRSGVARFENGAEIAIRSVEIRANTATETVLDGGKKSRTVEVVWTTGATVLRYSWADDEVYEEALEVSETAIRLDRMRDGASVLNSHWAWDLESVLGTIEDVRIEGGQGIARIRMSNRASIDEIWQDIQDGIIRHISVGYRVHGWTTVRKEGEMTRKTATDWEPHEISFVAVPADAGCSVRSDEPTPVTNRASENEMTTETTAPANDAGNEATRAAESAATVAADRQRSAQINRYAETYGVEASARDAAITAGTSFADFASAHMDTVAERQEETAVTAHRTTASVTGGTSPERQMELRAEAFSHRTLSDAGFAAPAISDQARSFLGDGMRGIAIACLRNAGLTVNENANDRTLIEQAIQIRSSGGVISSSDIATVLGQPLRAVMTTNYEDAIADTNYETWTGSTTTRDFKVSKLIHVGMLTGIRDISEGGQLPLAKLGAGARFFQIGSRGLKISFTREAIINDEYNALVQSVGKLGMIYKHDEQMIAVRALMAGKMTTENGEENIFDAAENGPFSNYVEVEALDDDGFAKAALALRSQVAGAEYGEGVRLSTKPRKLLVSADLEMDALRLTSVAIDAQGRINPVAKLNLTYEVIDDLPEGTAYLTGAKSLSDVIQVVRLAGAAGPQVEKLPPITYMGVEWESWNDFSAFGAGRFGIVKIKVTG